MLFSVSATITNTGKVNGEEVPQLYLNLGGPNDPKVVLRNFERLSIDAGMSTTFYADITRRDISNWDTVSQVSKSQSLCTEFLLTISRTGSYLNTLRLSTLEALLGSYSSLARFLALHE